VLRSHLAMPPRYAARDAALGVSDSRPTGTGLDVSHHRCETRTRGPGPPPRWTGASKRRADPVEGTGSVRRLFGAWEGVTRIQFTGHGGPREHALLTAGSRRRAVYAALLKAHADSSAPDTTPAATMRSLVLLV
jgi:hypothetical protein